VERKEKVEEQPMYGRGRRSYEKGKREEDVGRTVFSHEIDLGGGEEKSPGERGRRGQLRVIILLDFSASKGRRGKKKTWRGKLIATYVPIIQPLNLHDHVQPGKKKGHPQKEREGFRQPLMQSSASPNPITLTSQTG